MELLTIGRFAELTGLTVRALRYYEERGLLEPTAVDETNGYRLYAVEQAQAAAAIQRLRAADLSLAEIRQVLDEPERARELLEARRERLLELLQRVHDLIHDEEELVTEKMERVRFWLTIEEGPPRVLRFRQESEGGSPPSGRRFLDHVLEEHGLKAVGEPETTVLDQRTIETVLPIGPEGELKPPGEDRFVKRIELEVG
jgi:DNA-binding transcriptional MerR regulator